MDAQASSQTDSRGSAPPARIRELTIEEVDEVAGGALPLAVVAVAIIVAAVIQEAGDDSSSESESSDGGDGDE